MPKFSELSMGKQLGIVVVAILVLSGVAYYFVYKPMDDQNRTLRTQLKAKQDENAQLSQYEGRKVDLEQRIASLKQQMETLNRIVPDEKEAASFMEMVQGEASKAGIEVRRYTSQQISTKEFYSEVPFQIDLDGPYYSLLNFFDRVAKLERIINISGIKMASVKRAGEAQVKHQYDYAPNETVVVSCVATTYFSHSAPAPAPGAAPVKK